MRLPSTTFLALAGALHMAAAVHGMATETVMAGSSRSLLLMPIVDSTQAVESASAVIKDGQFATVAASSFATNVTLAIEGLKPGTTLVDITLTPAHAESFEGPTTISVLVEVVRSYALIPVTSALGWLCFILWSFSFYPQVCICADHTSSRMCVPHLSSPELIDDIGTVSCSSLVRYARELKVNRAPFVSKKCQDSEKTLICMSNGQCGLYQGPSSYILSFTMLRPNL